MWNTCYPVAKAYAAELTKRRVKTFGVGRSSLSQMRTGQRNVWSSTVHSTRRHQYRTRSTLLITWQQLTECVNFVSHPYRGNLVRISWCRLFLRKTMMGLPRGGVELTTCLAVLSLYRTVSDSQTDRWSCCTIASHAVDIDSVQAMRRVFASYFSVVINIPRTVDISKPRSKIPDLPDVPRTNKSTFLSSAVVIV